MTKVLYTYDNTGTIKCTSCNNNSLLSQQVAQLSQRDRAAGWVSNGQNWKTGTERQCALGRN